MRVAMRAAALRKRLPEKFGPGMRFRIGLVRGPGTRLICPATIFPGSAFPRSAFTVLALITPICPIGCAVPARADEMARWNPLIEEASARFAVPAAWIGQVMRAESAGRTQLAGRPIRSSKGAMGLMQLMPGTWKDMRARLGLGTDPDDPRDNVFAGTYYLRLLYDQFGYPGLFAAYNAGPARYAQYLAGRALPAETMAYLARTTGGPAQDSPARPSRPARSVKPMQTLFVVSRPREMGEDGAVDPAISERAPGSLAANPAPPPFPAALQAADRAGSGQTNAPRGTQGVISSRETPGATATRDPLFAVRNPAP